jgi:iron complex transport system substrate-binding protein
MVLGRFSALMVCGVMFFSRGVSAVVEVVDDAGRAVSLPHAATRIVSLAPHATELLFAAGAGDRIVGVVQYSDYPDAAKRIAQIGSSASLDLERIVELRPDLIVGWKSGNPAAAVERLTKLGLPVFLSEPRQLDDIASNIERLGVLTGTTTVASTVVASFRVDVQRLRAAHADATTVSVFYQIWDRPLITVNGRHLISAVLGLCGGRNVFAALAPVAPNVGVEDVLAADPQVIIASGSNRSRAGLRDWERFTQLQAVRNGQLHFVEPDYIQRPTPRILRGATEICAILDQARGAATVAPKFD